MLVVGSGIALLGIALALAAFLDTQFEIAGIKIGSLTPRGRRRALATGAILVAVGAGLMVAAAGAQSPRSLLDLIGRSIKPEPAVGSVVSPPAPPSPRGVEPEPEAAPPRAPAAAEPDATTVEPAPRILQKRPAPRPEIYDAPAPPPIAAPAVAPQSVQAPPPAPIKPMTTSVHLDLSRLEAALRRDTASANCDGRGRCYDVAAYVDDRPLFGSMSHELTRGTHHWRMVPSIRAAYDGPPEIRGSCSGVFEVTSERAWLAFRARFIRERDGGFRIAECELSEP